MAADQSVFFFINPITFSPDMLVSSTVAEDEHPFWDTSPKSTGDRVIYEHVIYEATANNTNCRPDLFLTGDDQKWFVVGSSNKFAAFDKKWGTRTVATGSLTMVIEPGAQINGLALMNMIGTNASLVMDLPDTGEVLHSQSITLISSRGVYDLLTYLTGARYIEVDKVFLDLPMYLHARITITVTGPGLVGIGNISMGQKVVIGQTEWGAKARIKSYSEIETDDYGNRSVTPGDYAKDFSCRIVVYTDFASHVQALLADVRDIPCVYSAMNARYSALVSWAALDEFEIDFVSGAKSYCTASFNGLV